jgi:hypothetical protein
MKYHIAFLAGLILVLGMFSYFIFSFNENRLFYFHGDKTDLRQTLNRFQKYNDARIEINFSALYGNKGQLQVLHPILDVRQLQIENVKTLCAGGSEPRLKGFTEPSGLCRQSSDVNIDFYETAAQRKTNQLVHFLYDKELLPSEFIYKFPFVDSQGTSYAYWLVKKGPPPFNQVSWIEGHLSYFKIAELREVMATYQIRNAYYSLITELTDSEIELAVRGEPLVLTSRYLMIRDQSRYGFSPLSYWVYDLDVFEKAINKDDYQLEPIAANTFCIQSMGNACWTYSSKYALSYLYKYSVAILIILGLVFLAFLAIYIRRLYEKNREQQKHRLSLQVLSHEFRTPVSSLLLMMEQLAKNQQKLDLSEQDLLTRVSTEVFRLQRIVEVSKTYLQAEGGRIHFNSQEISSINHWIADFIQDSQLNIQCVPLQQDQKFSADPFWLKFILSNLVQNAFAHGAEPVLIRLENTPGNLKITVQDQGHCEFKTLSKMTEAFAKSQKSKGMGLGLNIVKYIVDEWGGEIQFSNEPTSFTLFFAKSRLKGI